ncbi:long-chain fatty acid--CoA ligase [Ramlibacter sp.]|uniref:long-chain fatty acid--CoA ligase n=1 Tax=Ramlibacter sp. TaxID=1917967 RepID=UPI002C852919|nr:long-chain fatty acid--CoA ligase [Ramlibacter sp.]HWI80814.1 long-chain fatty acid--CoA ligase [Ramlibacter sp.]
MSNLHLPFWPKHAPQHLWVPETSLYDNLEVAAARFPAKPFIIFYDTVTSYRRFHQETERVAGYLQQACGVKKGDRVLLYLQNSPQFMTAFYGILRADAVVVPVNPMNLTNELRHYLHDSGAKVAFAAQELYPRLQPLLAEGLEHVIVAAYSDALEAPTDLQVPEFVAAPRLPVSDAGAVAWADMMAAGRLPAPMQAGPDDLAVMPYTSGTTGQPKGCMHTHRTTMYNAVAGGLWAQAHQGSVGLAVLPLFHVTGMQANLNGAIYNGGTVVVLPRWDRDAAAECVQRYRVTSMALITAMVIDFMGNPRLGGYDLSSLRSVGGGGAAMPKAVALAMERQLAIKYREGYGMSETMAATHSNPPERPKAQCLGVPLFDVDARVVEPGGTRELPPGQTGEIVVHGPQVMRGYWNQPQASAEVFVEIDGKRFLRTGDLACVDEEGYFFFVDRLKRMINAAGFKVWPAEVEAMLYHHPAVQEACVIAARDPRRGETVKAVVVLKPGHAGKVSAQDITDWAYDNMAAYKVPRIVQFVDSLPRSGAGKVMWRALQDAESPPPGPST